MSDTQTANFNWMISTRPSQRRLFFSQHITLSSSPVGRALVKDMGFKQTPCPLCALAQRRCAHTFLLTAREMVNGAMMDATDDGRYVRTRVDDAQ